MKKEDVGRRVRVFDRPFGEGSGLTGIIIDVFDDNTFRVKHDSGIISEYCRFTGRVQFLDGGT